MFQLSIHPSIRPWKAFTGSCSLGLGMERNGKISCRHELAVSWEEQPCKPPRPLMCCPCLTQPTGHPVGSVEGAVSGPSAAVGGSGMTVTAQTRSGSILSHTVHRERGTLSGEALYLQLHCRLGPHHGFLTADGMTRLSESFVLYSLGVSYFSLSFSI